MPLQEERGGRAEHQHQRQHARGGGVGADLADEELVGLDREDRLVLREHEGHAEILQRLHEDQQRA
jgi:hypothetical protein